MTLIALYRYQSASMSYSFKANGSIDALFIPYEVVTLTYLLTTASPIIDSPTNKDSI